MRHAKPSIVEVRQPQSSGHRSAQPEAGDRRAAYPVHLLARKTAEARMTAVDARRLPIAERLRRGQLVKGCSWTQGEPRMHGVIDVNRQGASQFK
jgi:hypothetical protein